jgi:hypothetical protein
MTTTRERVRKLLHPGSTPAFLEGIADDLVKAIQTDPRLAEVFFELHGKMKNIQVSNEAEAVYGRLAEESPALAIPDLPGWRAALLASSYVRIDRMVQSGLLKPIPPKEGMARAIAELDRIATKDTDFFDEYISTVGIRMLKDPRFERDMQEAAREIEAMIPRLTRCAESLRQGLQEQPGTRDLVVVCLVGSVVFPVWVCLALLIALVAIFVWG